MDNTDTPMPSKPPAFTTANQLLPQIRHLPSSAVNENREARGEGDPPHQAYPAMTMKKSRRFHVSPK